MFREPFPILYARDVERSARFYCDNFGFEQAFRWPSEGPLEYAFLRLGDFAIGIGESPAVPALARIQPDDGAPRFELCLYADDTDAACARLLARGVKQLAPPESMPWGERLAYFEDPDGNPIHVTAKVA